MAFQYVDSSVPDSLGLANEIRGDLDSLFADYDLVAEKKPPPSDSTDFSIAPPLDSCTHTPDDDDLLLLLEPDDDNEQTSLADLASDLESIVFGDLELLNAVEGDGWLFFVFLFLLLQIIFGFFKVQFTFIFTTNLPNQKQFNFSFILYYCCFCF